MLCEHNGKVGWKQWKNGVKAVGKFGKTHLKVIS